MGALQEHQREIVAVARQQSVLVSAPQRVGKTFMAAHVLRDHVLLFPTTAVAGQAPKSVAVAVAATETARAELYRELARLCGVQILTCDDIDDASQNGEVQGTQQQQQQQQQRVKSTIARRWESDLDWVWKQFSECIERHGQVVAVLSPAVMQTLLRKQVLSIADVGVVVIEETEQVHMDAPAFYRALFDNSYGVNAVPMEAQPRIFATTSVPASRLNLSAASRNALYAHIQVLNFVPVLNPSQLTTPPTFPPLMREPFDPNAKLIGKSASGSDESMEQYQITVGMREFLYGENIKKIDFIRILRMELEMGNSAAVYDEKKRQDKINRFVQDADSIYQHLGYWCLLKFIELELQANLTACLVDDEQNVNHRTKRQQEEKRREKRGELEEGEEDEPMESDTESLDEDDTENVAGNAENDPQTDLLAALIASKMELDEPTQQKVNPILKLITWLGTQTRKIGVMTMFKDGATNVMVTTSIAKRSQKQKTEPPSCDLVVVMDELLEPNKLFEFGKRAHPVTGVVKYITQNTAADFKKFNSLVIKMHDFVQLDEEQNAAQTTSQTNTASGTSGGEMSSDVSDLLNGGNTARGMQGRIQVTPRVVAAVNPFEIVNQDTGAVLNLSSAVACLSKFCDSLPGLDTYDKRPQYIVKRHPLSSGMSAATKQCKKKRFKYNAKIHDKIDDLRAEAEAKLDAEPEEDVSRFEFTATLKLPMSLGVKKKLASYKVPTPEEAKGIVAFKACQELIKKGLLDRHFRSRLIEDLTATIHCDKDDANKASEIGAGTLDTVADDTIVIEADDDVPQPEKLKDLSTQNSYDLPPVSAAELSLRPIRTLLGETGGTSGVPCASVTMCFYGLTGVRYAILTTNELYTGNTNTGWRYDFATSNAMEPDIQPVTLAKSPAKIELSKQELQDALHFHLIIMRLVCMGVQDAMRDVDIAGDDVWKEFSEQNDKGYLVVPSIFDAVTKTFSIDWEYVRDILGKPLIQPIWPFPAASEYLEEEWICVPTHRRNVTYVVKSVSTQTAKDMKVAFADKEAWNKHIKEGKSSQGNPILGRWHTSEQIMEAEDDQPLIYGIQVPPIVPIIRRVMQRNNAEGSIATYSTKFNERLLIPEFTSLLCLTKARYFEAIGIVPVLYEFERKCQMSNLMGKIGLELDISLLDDATSKPAYERLEILGDTFLKLETSWFMYENRKDIVQEGELTRLRRDIIRNDRLNQFALAARLHHYILHPAEIEQHPFEHWKPSCMGKTPKAIVAPTKWIADVLEAICGAYLLGQGEKGARYFLKWIGVSCLEEPFIFSRPFYPDCFPCELYDDDFIGGNGVDHLALDFSIARFEDLPQRLVWLQQRLKYTFRNKRLLLEAVTHPSAGHLELQMIVNRNKHSDSGQQKMFWRGDYERLEYLGDAIIEYLTLSYAFLQYDKWLPGSLSQWKSATVSNDALGKTALACFGVDECICAGAVRMDRETMQIVSRIERKYSRSGTGDAASSTNFTAISTSSSRKKVKATGTNPMSLPKMFADVFEALVAAVFLDSGNDLQTTRDVFLGPLLDTVGKDALAYVCHESGLTIDQYIDNGGDQDEIMESLFSDED
ncbi:Dicer [Globisporangium polare]